MATPASGVIGVNRHKNGRIHLPIAPHCNIRCAYCDRKHDCANESRPGVTSRLLIPGITEDKIPLIAERVSEAGAYVMLL